MKLAAGCNEPQLLWNAAGVRDGRGSRVSAGGAAVTGGNAACSAPAEGTLNARRSSSVEGRAAVLTVAAEVLTGFGPVNPPKHGTMTPPRSQISEVICALTMGQCQPCGLLEKMPSSNTCETSGATDLVKCCTSLTCLLGS